MRRRLSRRSARGKGGGRKKRRFLPTSLFFRQALVGGASSGDNAAAAAGDARLWLRGRAPPGADERFGIFFFLMVPAAATELVWSASSKRLTSQPPRAGRGSACPQGLDPYTRTRVSIRRGRRIRSVPGGGRENAGDPAGRLAVPQGPKRAQRWEQSWPSRAEAQGRRALGNASRPGTARALGAWRFAGPAPPAGDWRLGVGGLVAEWPRSGRVAWRAWIIASRPAGPGRGGRCGG